jgi:hypothetical protein
MVLKGHIKNGVVVFDTPPPFEEGTEVQVMLEDEEGPTILERFAGSIGSAEGLPEDAAENVDHYLYGAPKK